jgi:protein-L-isoaspartate(D-aspartate) O-methyltransferase
MEALTKLAETNTRKHHAELLDDGRVMFLTRDGRLGYPAGAPYDVIHVGAAATAIPKPVFCLAIQ